MYRTEDLLKPQASVQAAALAALCFIPVVASEPQLLLPLMLSFLVFLMLVRSHTNDLAVDSAAGCIRMRADVGQCGALRGSWYLASDFR